MLEVSSDCLLHGELTLRPEDPDRQQAPKMFVPGARMRRKSTLNDRPWTVIHNPAHSSAAVTQQVLRIGLLVSVR
jgi:hypothetical protein